MGARAELHGHDPGPPTPQPELFSLEEERHIVEDLGELAPLVQILDLPVPQLEDHVVDALQIPERPMAVQVIEVPKILVDVIPEPQTAGQLVEVPAVLSPTRIALQIVVASGVFKVFSENRVQQRRLLLWNAFRSGLWS